MTDTIAFTHTAAAADWANSPERKTLFTVEQPNPDRVAWDAADSHAEGEVAPAETVTVDYTMPAKPNAGLALQYIRLARSNPDIALSWLIEEAIGEKGYDALVEELVGKEDAGDLLQSLAQTIQTVALGGLEVPKA